MTREEAYALHRKWQYDRRWQNSPGYNGDGVRFSAKAGHIWDRLLEIVENNNLTDWSRAMESYEKAMDKLAYPE